MTLMKDVKYIIGMETVLNTPMKPYADMVCAFAAELSAALMKEPECRRYPDVMSFAFWCRKGNIQNLKGTFESKEKRIGRGLVFHVAPSNVPINFAFSFMFSLLAGNANIVRVPSKPFPQVSLICRVLNKILEGYPEIKKRTAFITYPADNVITEQYSLIADARVIWGGDSTINQIRKCEVKAKCIDLVFADRYSISIINGDAVLSITEEELVKLAEDFYNDSYLMDQNACSSPQLICWNHASKESKSRFWKAVFRYTKSRYNLQAASAVDKYMQMCQDAVRLLDVRLSEKIENILYCVQLKELPEDITELRGHCGYFYEYDYEDLAELKFSVTEKFQTVTYFGCEPEEIREFVLDNNLRGIDRIVPIGKSLDIGVIWDGYDIVGILSRIIDVL